MAETFGQALHRLAAERGLSLRAVARHAHLDPGHLSRVAADARTPTPELALAADKALEAGGSLLALVTADDRRNVDAAARESSRLTAFLDVPVSDLVDRLGADADRLALAYLSEPAATMHDEALGLRRLAAQALRDAQKTGAVADLTVAVGRLSGVLSYAALDLGKADAAMVHADLAYRCGERAGNGHLAAWARGTQSLIARFSGDYSAALAYAVSGLENATADADRARLLCGITQCYANLGDAREAYRAVADAGHARDSVAADDVGLLGFSGAKQLYYTASSMIWLPEPADARNALNAAEAAITAWESGRPEDRSLDDEALAHLYAATAAAQLHDLEAAVTYLEPILGLPPDRRISWIRKRMIRVAELLTEPPYTGQQLAAETIERIREYR
jgi:transcriptional regulator with XRE-family HTH domain